MAQSTRTPRGAGRVRAPGPAGYVVGGVICVAGIWLALARGAGLGLVVGTAFLGVVIGTAVLRLLPRRWSLPAFVVVLVVGAGILSRLDRGSIPAWFGGVVLGLVLGLQLLGNHQQRAATERAPSATSRSGSGLRLVVDEGPDEIDTMDPTEQLVSRRFQALDGHTRTGLSVFRGSARLDVGGDVAGPVLVFQCDDTTMRQPVWSVVTTGSDPYAGGEVDVRIAGLAAHLPAGSVTTPDSAVAALEVFLRTGARAPGLAWCTDRDVGDLRAPFDRWR